MKNAFHLNEEARPYGILWPKRGKRSCSIAIIEKTKEKGDDMLEKLAIQRVTTEALINSLISPLCIRFIMVLHGSTVGVETV